MLFKIKLILKMIFHYLRNLFKYRKSSGSWYRVKDNYDKTLEYKITDWQKRQKEIIPWKFFEYKKFNKLDLIGVHYNVLSETRYITDPDLYFKQEYWATTDEVLKYKAGDCEDQAHLIMLRLLELGIDPNILGCVFIHNQEEDKDTYHVFAIVQYAGDDFYILDNGSLSYALTTAKKFLSKNKNITVLAAYNFNDIWSYNNIEV